MRFFKSVLYRLRILGVLEGVSFLLLLLVGMPLKYIFEIMSPNKIIGIIHGLLFLFYNVLAYQTYVHYGWTFKKLFYLIIASILPLGTFIIDAKILKLQKDKDLSS